MKSLLVGLLLCEASWLASAVSGPNACVTQEKFMQTMRVNVKVPVTIREYTWCLSVPPRCSKYKTVIKDKYQTQSVEKTRDVSSCCDGYVTDRTGEGCAAYCEGGCGQGQCERPDHCVCEAGYGGTNCDSKCDEGKWGPGCTEDCSCDDASQCSPETGQCQLNITTTADETSNSTQDSANTTSSPPLVGGGTRNLTQTDVEDQPLLIPLRPVNDSIVFIDTDQEATSTNFTSTNPRAAPSPKHVEKVIASNPLPTQLKNGSEETNLLVTSNLSYLGTIRTTVQEAATRKPKTQSFDPKALGREDIKPILMNGDSSNETGLKSVEASSDEEPPQIDNTAFTYDEREFRDEPNAESKSMEPSHSGDIAYIQEEADLFINESPASTSADLEELTNPEASGVEYLPIPTNRDSERGAGISSDWMMDQSSLMDPGHLRQVSKHHIEDIVQESVISSDLMYTISVAVSVSVMLILMAAVITGVAHRRKRRDKQRRQQEAPARTEESLIPVGCGLVKFTGIGPGDLCEQVPLPQLFGSPVFYPTDIPLDESNNGIMLKNVSSFNSGIDHRISVVTEGHYDIPPSARPSLQFFEGPEPIYDEIPAWRSVTPT